MTAKDRGVDEDASFRSDGDPPADDIDALEFEAEGGRKGVGRHAERHPADREHGTKTKARSKEIVSGRPFAG